MQYLRLIGKALWALVGAQAHVGWLSIAGIALFGCCVIVPLVLQLLQRDDAPWLSFDARTEAMLVLFGQLAAAAAFALPPQMLNGVAALMYVVFTAWLALRGFARLAEGAYQHDLAGMCKGIGMLYLLIGGLWLIPSRTGMSLISFSEPIVTLTVVHFHYACFAAPVMTGIALHALKDLAPMQARARDASALAVMAGPALIATGFLGLPGLEIAGVTALTLALVTQAALLLNYAAEAPQAVRMPARLLLAFAALGLFATMGLAWIHGFNRLRGEIWPDIASMLAWHGRFNAFGFVLLGLLAWRLMPADPPVSGVRDAQLLQAWRDTPVNFLVQPADAPGYVRHTYRIDLGPDPDGLHFALMRGRLLRYVFYPPHILTHTAAFDDGERRMQPGDAVILRAFLLPALRISMRMLNRIDCVVDQRDRAGFGYVTTARHVEQGAWSVYVTRDAVGSLQLSIDSIARPVGLLRPFGPVLRWYQVRAHRAGIALAKLQIAQVTPSRRSHIQDAA